MSGIDRIGDFFGRVVDWTCLDKLRLETIVIGLLTFEFVMSIILLVPTMVIHFTYVNPAGRSGFVDQKWINHTDIFKFRREQPWELDFPVDWDEGDRLYINETREILDESCSKYEHNISIPGDAGDYLKEVAGHPNLSGYNKEIVAIIRLWTAAISMMYFSCPILLIALWWKKQTAHLVAAYIVVQLFPMFLLIAASVSASHPLMCATDIIYSRHSLKIGLIIFIILLWIYELCKFVILTLYCIEQHLSRKRKDYGFKRTGMRRRQVAPGENPEDEGQVGDDYDVEKTIAKGRKSIGVPRKSMHGKSFNNKNTAQSMIREILELGTTTQDDSGVGESRQPSAIRQSIAVPPKRKQGSLVKENRKVGFGQD